ncbi:MAG: hypothetical protein CVU14_06115 [Bacteroidetes bacterium HGW-Bacteroidetes-9]|nr:MAG: hypothetical protein CVU14_06115 [Bacteroidetes bacterium HGW-Bacteroidetes-9]
MRKTFTNALKVLTMLALIMNFGIVKGQSSSPSAEQDFLLTIQNVVQISPNVFEFDIYLLDIDNTQPMYLATTQHGINFNPLILNGGAITPTMTTIVPGFSDLPSTMEPISVSTVTPGLIRVAGRAAPGAGNGYVVSQVAPGTRITRLRLTNSVAFPENSTADMSFNSNTVTNPSYPTRIAIYIGTTNTQIPVTPGVNANVLENPILNPPVPLAFNVTGTGSYCQGGLGTPVGLSGSQVGTTYTLYKDAVAQVPTVAGTGSAITFGNQLAGTYTVEGTNGSGTSPMTGSAIITEDTPVAVSVTATPDQNNVCSGTSVTFTAMPTNGGTPAYQWYNNGSTVGTNSASYTFTPVNNDQVYVVMTSSLTCTTGNPATSATTTMIVNPSLPVSVTATPDQNNICAGTSVTFTATPTNGGTPSYQWYLNGVMTGLDQDTYTLTPANGDQIYVVMTSSLAGCLSGNPATSATTTMVVNSNPVNVTIAPSANPVCLGSDVTFTATPVNGGTASYQWYLNGVMAGLDQATYTFTPADGDQVYVVLTSDLTCTSNNPATSATTTLAVNAPLPVSVTAAPDQNNICAGTSVTFTATPVNGGTPTYQWYLNGAAAGANSATYTFAPANNDQVYVVMTSSLGCITGSPATSGTTTMVVNPLIPVSVTVAVDQNNICQGTSVTFTATPVNGGATPTYQWYRNGAMVGSNQATYTVVPNNNDQVYVVMTTSLTGCVTSNPATSNTTTMAVYPPLVASVTAAASMNNVCQGTSVTFTATPVNGGTTPAYQWYLNGGMVGSNQATYTFTPNNNDQVYVVMTSSIAACISGTPATSNTTTMVVNPLLPVSVTAVVDQNNVCQGTSVTFTATPVNGGTPTYQWYRNGSMVGSNQATYTFVPNNGDMVYVTMTSSLTCISGSPATSATTTMVVNPLQPVSVSITPDQNNVCQGTSVTFTATPVNGGTPTYQWYLNGIAVGSNQATYTIVPNNGDMVYVMLTSSLTTCVTGNPATSNTVTMVTYPGAAASVTIVAGSNDVCEGTEVVFTAFPVNGGTSPVYQWGVNGVNVGTNSPQFAYYPEDGDEVLVVLTSNLVCVSNNPAVSNTIDMIVNPVVEVTANISVAENGLCSGETMYFSSTTTNGGTSPTYQWQVNGLDVGTSSPSYSYVPMDGDMVRLIFTSSVYCAMTNPVASNQIEAMVYDLPVVTWASYEYDTLCSNWGPMELSGGLPEGGEYSGSGVANNMFSPGVVGVGEYTLTYTYTDEFGCEGSAEYTVYVDECINAGNLTPNASSVVLFPNPTNDKLYVSLLNVGIPKTIRMFNTTGNLMFESNQMTKIIQHGIEVSQLSPGMYTLQLIFNNGIVNKVFIVK